MYAKTIIIGRLGQAPVLNHTRNNMPVAKFSVATGQDKDNTTWYDVVTWGKTAEVCATHLEKGRLVCVEGSMKREKYTAKDGTEKIVWVLNANHVKFLSHGERPADVARETITNETISVYEARENAINALIGRPGVQASLPASDDDFPF